MKIQLKEIVGQFLNSAEQGSHEFLRLWNMGVWGMKTEFNLDITGAMKTVMLDVNGNNTVDIPCDCITYSKIGILNGNGEVLTYKRNDDIAKVKESNDGLIDGTPVEGGGISTFVNSPLFNTRYMNYNQGGTSYCLYGLDGGTPQRGEYTVDISNKIIYLGMENSYPAQIVFEYLSDGYEENINDYQVDIRAAEAMLSYLRWYNAKDNKKYGVMEVRQLKLEYYNQKRLARMRINAFVLNEIREVSMRSIKLTVKY